MLVNREFYGKRGEKKPNWIHVFYLPWYSNHRATPYNMELPFLNEIFMAWSSFYYPFILDARAVIPEKLKTFPFRETEISAKSGDAGS